MVNNLLEPRGGVGHITTVLPFFAMYFFLESKYPREKVAFWIYIFLSTIWSYDRVLFQFKLEIETIDDITMTLDVIIYGLISLIMILASTILFIIYLKGLVRLEKFHFSFKSYFTQFYSKSYH
jgi:hypothetical protein